MAKFKSEDLLSELAEDLKRVIESANYLKSIDKTKLVYSPDKGRWSIVQILEHLNAYNRFYLPKIEKELSLITYDNVNPWFSSGFFGELLTNSMKPKNVYEIKNKMKTAKKYNFPNSLNVETVFNEFLAHQHRLLKLLEQAKKRDLNKIKLPSTLTGLLQLKLGDVFRFLIAHEQRHMIQARNTLRSVGVATDKFPVILQVVPQ